MDNSDIEEDFYANNQNHSDEIEDEDEEEEIRVSSSEDEAEGKHHKKKGMTRLVLNVSST